MNLMFFVWTIAARGCTLCVCSVFYSGVLARFFFLLHSELRSFSGCLLCFVVVVDGRPASAAIGNLVFVTC